RMVAYSPKLWEAPGEALPDWEILARFARRLGFSGFDWASAAEVWDEFAGLTAGRPCDMAGVTAAPPRGPTGLPWPFPATDPPPAPTAAPRPPPSPLPRPGRFPPPPPPAPPANPPPTIPRLSAPPPA